MFFRSTRHIFLGSLNSIFDSGICLEVKISKRAGSQKNQNFKNKQLDVRQQHEYVVSN